MVFWITDKKDRNLYEKGTGINFIKKKQQIYLIDLVINKSQVVDGDRNSENIDFNN